jgi:hypothetical protein
MTSLFRKSGLVLTFSALASLPVLAAEPAAVLPDEAVAYAEMDSLGLLKLEEHPVAKKVPVNDLKSLMYKISGQSPEDEEKMKKLMADEMGMSYEELEKKFGKVAVAVHDLKVPAEPTPENIGVEFSLAGEMDGDEAFAGKYARTIFKLIGEQAKKQGGNDIPELDEILKKIEEHVEHSTTEHGGVKVHVLKVKESDETKEAPAFIKEWAYAIHEKMFILSSGVDGVEEMLDRIKAGSDKDSLAASALYKADHEKAGKSLILASLNLETILGLVEKYGLPQAETDDVDVEKVWKALGADKLKSAVLAFGATDTAVDFTALLTHDGKPGLMALPSIPGPGKAPAFLPKDAVSASYQQIDLDESLENLSKLMGEMNPAWGGLVDMGLGMAQSQTGVDIRKELLANLGPDVWTFTGKLDVKKPGSGDESEQMMALSSALSKGVYGIKVKDSKAVGNAIKSLINAAGQEDGLFEDTEYQGFTVRKIKAVPPPMAVSYVLTDDWFILNLNDQESLEQILGNLKKDAADGFFSNKTVSDMLDGMRGNQAATSVLDLGAMLGALSEMFSAISEISGDADMKKVPWDDVKKLAKLPLWVGNKIWLQDDVTEVRFRVVPKE